MLDAVNITLISSAIADLGVDMIMRATDTVVLMVGIFLIAGCLVPTLMMLRGRCNNRIILWMIMIFAIVLVFGVIVDFSYLDNDIRSLVIEYGFKLTMVFGAIFGIDLLLQGNYIRSVRWKDLNIDVNDDLDKVAVKVETTVDIAKDCVSTNDCDSENKGV